MILLIILFLYIPIALPLMSFGSKPIDIVFSDLLILITVSLFVLDNFKKNKLYLSNTFKNITSLIALNIFYALSIMLFYYINSSELTAVLSMIKLYKMLLLFIVGYYISFRFDFNYYSYSLYMINIIILIIFFTTLFHESFPLILWGSHFLSFDLYGYPNNGMTFFSFLLLFPLMAFFKSKNYWYLLVYIIGFTIVVLSLSRSSSIGLILSSLFLLFKFVQIRKILIFIPIIIVTSILFVNEIKDNEKVSKLIDLVEYRIDRTLGNTDHDASSGRFEIWGRTIDVISRKPIFGYGFEPFSNQQIDHFDTPHNQYLEIIYKTGLIGFILFFILIIYMVVSIKRYRYSEDDDIIKNIFLYGLLAILFGSLTQPNLSFAPLGNLLFFIAGYLIAKNIKKVEHVKKL